jgi:AcrR family transcriptional regulator
VPKRVDHEERRQRIADALVRSAATRGLHATGMREVAAEAGVSLRLVQYYFGTKEELLLAAMQQLAGQLAERAMARVLTDPALAISPLVKNSAAVTEVVAAQLRTAQSAGDSPADLDPDLEALSLMSLSAGLGTSVLAGHSTPDQAQAVIDYQLRRLFPS